MTTTELRFSPDHAVRNSIGNLPDLARFGVKLLTPPRSLYRAHALVYETRNVLFSVAASPSMSCATLQPTERVLGAAIYCLARRLSRSETGVRILARGFALSTSRTAFLRATDT